MGRGNSRQDVPSQNQYTKVKIYEKAALNWIGSKRIGSRSCAAFWCAEHHPSFQTWGTQFWISGRLLRLSDVP
jgi:hypothetical protein